jgi:ribosomal protein L32
MVPHRVCPACGYYAGRKVIELKVPEQKEGA